ncbi:MAG: class I SAM-dependent methyltransferase [bacterium]|nr:class I SAM-dependent methyltransferase [bacterium]
MQDGKLLRFANSFGAKYVHIKTLSGLSGLFCRPLWAFRFEALKRMAGLYAVQRLAKHAYKMSSGSEQVIASIYDIEYQGNRPNYMYLNALLFPEQFNKITGIAAPKLNDLQIIDIGAGSNELLRFLHHQFGVNSRQLHGTDISPASTAIIRANGFHGYTGRIEHLGFPTNHFDLAFLSYFLDFDTDQEKTFEEAVRITKPNGEIILEGKFPAYPFGVPAADRKHLNFLTKGKDACEDIELVFRALMQIASVQNKSISLQRIIRSERYVFSRYGLCRLPSFFLVMKISASRQVED